MRHLDHTSKIADSPSDKKQKGATAFLRRTIQIREFAGPIAARASKILGPVNRHLMAQLVPMMRDAARASPGLAVGILRVLCNGMCMAQRRPISSERPLGLTCQRLLLKNQLRLRFTLQHLYSHAQNMSRYRIELQWKNVSRSQSAGRRSKSSIYVEPRPKHST